MVFDWNDQKNEQLKTERNIRFEDVVIAIEQGGLIRKIIHPNKKQYSNQLILLVVIEQYIYVVPAVPIENGYFLKTIYKSRKYTKILLGGSYE